MATQGDKVRRSILRQLRFETTYRRCSNCKEKKPQIVRVGPCQMCQDCLRARIK